MFLFLNCAVEDFECINLCMGFFLGMFWPWIVNVVGIWGRNVGCIVLCESEKGLLSGTELHVQSGFVD